jgi:hypothetical protein
MPQGAPTQQKKKKEEVIVKMSQIWPDEVSQAYNYSYLEIQGLRGQPWAKSSQDPISTHSWLWWCTPVI